MVKSSAINASPDGPSAGFWAGDVRVERLLRGLSEPGRLSQEMRWKLAARGISVEVLRECLELLDEAAEPAWPSIGSRDVARR